MRPATARQRARREIDLAIRNCAPTDNRKATDAYLRLVAVVRHRTDLLQPRLSRRYGPVHVARCTLGGLVNLSMFHNAWQRSCEGWLPRGTSARRIFNSLVRFLLDNHPVPAFMTSCWLSAPEGRTSQRIWYTHFARSGTIRGTSTPCSLTRHQARCFAESPDHVSVAEALNRGQQEITADQRMPRPKVVTRRRWKKRQAKRQRWFRGDWPAIAIPDFTAPGDSNSPWGYKSWSIRQIVRWADLIEEGRELSHCVSTYHDDCRRGRTSIWSLRSHGLTTQRRILTIELNPRQRQVITALGFRNSKPAADARRIMEEWASLNQLSIASWV